MLPQKKNSFESVHQSGSSKSKICFDFRGFSMSLKTWIPLKAFTKMDFGEANQKKKND